MILKKIVTPMVVVMSLLGLIGLSAIAPSYTASASTVSEVKSGVTGVGGDTDGNRSGDVAVTIKKVIGILLFLIGMIAVIFIVIAGFRFVTSNGDSNTVSAAKDTIIYSVLGIIIAVMAYAIVNFIIDNIT